MIQFESERLIIRDHIPSDHRAFHQWISDATVMTFLDWKTDSEQHSLELLQESIDESNKENRTKYFFAIVLKESNTIVGDTGFTVIARNKHEIIGDCGYFILKEHWGNGYASEAFQALISYAFENLHAHKLIATCDKENTASENIMKKCSMIKEAEFSQHYFHRGKWCDKLQYRLLKEEWKRLYESRIHIKK